ncbi:MAG: hypothetical protein KF774_18915 [Planctomyces sp.]|nr:hypothetical protein [Planctomyces sp.]
MRPAVESGLRFAGVVETWGSEAFEEPGFELVLVCLGTAEDDPPFRACCDNLWHFDTECIEGPGSYARIAQRMSELTQGSLPIIDVEDHVDDSAGEAWLEFKCFGRPVHIDLEFSDDWVDVAVFSAFAGLLAQHDPGKLYFLCDLDGQDCVIGCLTRARFEKLRALGSNVHELS